MSFDLENGEIQNLVKMTFGFETGISLVSFQKLSTAFRINLKEKKFQTVSRTARFKCLLGTA